MYNYYNYYNYYHNNIIIILLLHVIRTPNFSLLKQIKQILSG